MAAVTISASQKVAYYSAGNIGWSARSLFAYRTTAQQLAGANTLNLGSVSSSSAVAQSWTTGSALSLAEVRVVLFKVNSPTDDISLEIRADSSNKPSATV